MKRFYSFCIVFILIFNLMTYAVYANNTEITVSSEINGSDVVITVGIKNNPGFIAFSIDTKYDKDAIYPICVAESTLLENGGDSITSNINGSTYSADFVSAVWTSLKPANSDGILFTINFKQNDGYVGSETSLSIVCNEFLTDEKSFIEVSPVDLTIKFPSDDSTTVNTPVLLPDITLKSNADIIPYMNDYGDEFKPLKNATRYEIIDALYNLFNIKNIDENLRFSDVADDYKTKVAAFASVGVVSGYEDGTFGGEKSVTRAEFVKLLTTAFKCADAAKETEYFNDIADHWAKDYINAFASFGYAKGYENSDGTYSFRPDDYVTRSEAVVFINRIINAKGKASEKIYIDLSADYWAYDEIIKVIN